MVDSSSPQRKFIVDEGGNKRQQISEDDVRQATNDIVEWFKTNAGTYYSKNLEKGSGAPAQGDVIDTLKLFRADNDKTLI